MAAENEPPKKRRKLEEDEEKAAASTSLPGIVVLTITNYSVLCKRRFVDFSINFDEVTGEGVIEETVLVETSSVEVLVCASICRISVCV